MRSRYANTLKCMPVCVSFVTSLVLVTMAAPEDAAFVPGGRRPPECYDRDSYTPLCTNQFGSYCCHWENVRNHLKWQRDALKEGLANYDRGDAGMLMKTTYYLSAYARKLERRGLGYEAATNAYCALSWLYRSALRGCEEARLACGCCLASGGARGHHSLHIWSGPASCYSQDLHDVPAQAMAYFEPAPEYLLDDKDGGRRYVRAYDQCMEMSSEYFTGGFSTPVMA